MFVPTDSFYSSEIMLNYLEGYVVSSPSMIVAFGTNLEGQSNTIVQIW